ncbi:MAG: ANTAR domain-containing protein [Pseudomonadota bacterium]
MRQKPGKRKSRGIGEQEAYKRLRDKSQNSQTSIGEVAQAILAAHDVLNSDSARIEKRVLTCAKVLLFRARYSILPKCCRVYACLSR